MSQVWSRIWGKIENILYLIYQSFSWIQPPKMSMYNSFSEQISFRVHALGHVLCLSKQQPLRGPFTTKSMIFRQQQQKVDNKKFSREFHRPERVRVSWGGRFFWNFFKVIYKVVFLRIRNDSSCLIYCLSRMKLSI